MGKQCLRVLGILLMGFLPVFGWSQGGVIKGRLTDAINNEAIPFGNVLIMGTSTGTTSDVDGNYEISGLEPGSYDVQATFVGYETTVEYEVQVTNARPAVVNFEMRQSSQELEEVVVKASPFRKTVESPLSLRTIGVAEIQRNPGGNRDISRVVQTLPGVTSSNSFRNDLLIRGGGPNENRFYLDGVEVPNINHFATQGASGGPVGLINVNFIREVEFYSGAFPANRGNALSSVFEFQQREGRDDRPGATFFLSATDAGLTLEGPIGEKTTYLLSARRSYLQLLFEALELPFLPTYNDFQAKIKHRFDDKNELTFIGLGAIDQFRLNEAANETEEQQYILNNIPDNEQWNYATGLVYKRYTASGYWTFVVSRNKLNNNSVKYQNNDESSPENLLLDYESEETENKLRIEHTARFSDFRLNVGVGAEQALYTNRTFNRIATGSGLQEVDFSSELTLNRYFMFGQLSRKFFNDRLALSLGIRTDANDYSSDMNNPLDQFSPRFSLTWAFAERLAFNFNSGIYHQLPPYTVLGYRESGVLANKQNGVRYIRNRHLVAGFEFNTAASSKLTLEGYYKAYDRYPFLLRDSISLANVGADFGVVGNEPVTPDSEGRSYGFEFLFQQRLYKGYYGILSYTLGWSEFQDKNGAYLPSSWDSRHIVNLVVGKKIGKSWEVGVNWRYQSGLPNTPFSAASSLVQVYDRRNDGLPDYNRLNTERLSGLSTLDFRVDKRWFFKQWSMNVYLDIENFFGSAVENFVLTYDRMLDENGLPIGDPIILNPSDPPEQQRYLLKELNTSSGTPIPSIGVLIEY